MREKINEMWEMLKNFDAYDWTLVFMIVAIVWMIDPLIHLINYLFEGIMKKVFKMERCIFIKGWKKIK